MFCWIVKSLRMNGITYEMPKSTKLTGKSKEEHRRLIKERDDDYKNIQSVGNG